MEKELRNNHSKISVDVKICILKFAVYYLWTNATSFSNYYTSTHFDM